MPQHETFVIFRDSPVFLNETPKTNLGVSFRKTGADSWSALFHYQSVVTTPLHKGMDKEEGLPLRMGKGEGPLFSPLLKNSKSYPFLHKECFFLRIIC